VLTHARRLAGFQRRRLLPRRPYHCRAMTTTAAGLDGDGTFCSSSCCSSSSPSSSTDQKCHDFAIHHGLLRAAHTRFRVRHAKCHLDGLTLLPPQLRLGCMGVGPAAPLLAVLFPVRARIRNSTISSLHHGFQVLHDDCHFYGTTITYDHNYDQY